MKKVGFHRLAKEEFKESTRWYECQRRGLGTEFRQEVEAAIARIASHPEWYGFIEGDKRLHQVHRFPFGIVYQVLPKRIFILLSCNYSVILIAGKIANSFYPGLALRTL